MKNNTTHSVNTPTYWYESPMFQHSDKVQADTSLLGTEPKFRNDVTVKLVEVMGDENTIVNSARASSVKHSSDYSDEANKGLIKSLVRHGHGTPFEYVNFIFYFEVPIFVSRQIVKYRHTSINESSGRYSTAIPEFYVIPRERPIVQIGKTMDYRFEEAYDETGIYDATAEIQRSMAKASWTNYTQLVAHGVAKEVARMHLPVTTYSHMYCQMNLRTALHFVSQRLILPEDTFVANRSHPQWEISLVAEKIAEIIEEKFPTVWENFVKKGYTL